MSGKSSHNLLSLTANNKEVYISKIFNILLNVYYCDNKEISKDLLHWNAKLDRVRRLLFSRPHQSQEPVGSEDSQLRVTKLVERVSESSGKPV